MKKALLFFFIVVLTICVIVVANNANLRYSKKLEENLYPYPEEYRELTEKYSEEYGVPLEMICAVIRTESNFDPKAVSHAGAVGLMQITEPTLWWLMSKLGETKTLEDLYDPETNIKYGTFFLSILLEKFEDRCCAEAAYNAGMTRVSNWLKEEAYSKDGKTLDTIPITETKRYVEKVEKAIPHYTKLYFTEKSDDGKAE